MNNLLSRNELKQIVGGLYEFTEGGGSGTPKIDACSGKSRGAECSWDYNEKQIYGHCTSHLGGAIYCSDLL